MLWSSNSLVKLDDHILKCFSLLCVDFNLFFLIYLNISLSSYYKYLIYSLDKSHILWSRQKEKSRYTEAIFGGF